MLFDSSWIVIESSPGPITARVGRSNLALDRLLKRHGFSGCAYFPEPLPAEIADRIRADDGIPWIRVDAHRIQDDAYAPVERGECWLGMPRALAAALVSETLGRDTLVWHETGRPTTTMHVAPQPLKIVPVWQPALAPTPMEP